MDALDMEKELMNIKEKKLQHAILYGEYDGEESKLIENMILSIARKIGVTPTNIYSKEDIIQDGWVGIIEFRNKYKEENKNIYSTKYSIIDSVKKYNLSPTGVTIPKSVRFSSKGRERLSFFTQNAFLRANTQTLSLDESYEFIDVAVNEDKKSEFTEEILDKAKTLCSNKEYNMFKMRCVDGLKIVEIAKIKYSDYKNMDNEQKKKIRNNISHTIRNAVKKIKKDINNGNLGEYFPVLKENLVA